MSTLAILLEEGSGGISLSCLGCISAAIFVVVLLFFADRDLVIGFLRS